MSGGPLEGVLEVVVEVERMIVLTHVRCACEWCAGEGERVEHLYERREDGVFVYQGRRVPEPLRPLPDPNLGAFRDPGMLS